MRLAALGILLLFVPCERSALAQQLAAAKQLQVVIISVESFDDPQYQSPLLQQNIRGAADNLIQFFSTQFPSAKQTVLRTHDDTTSAHLTEFLKGQFRSIADGNITLLFVLSHGEALPSPNPASGSDLRIVASDTPANELGAKSISLSKEIVGNVTDLSPGSFLFGFIDTCHGGAAGNFGLTLDAAVANLMGVRTMFMASSQSDQLAFQASFTRALVDIWNQPSTSSGTIPACTVPEVSINTIRSKVQEILSTTTPPMQLGPTDGYPVVLVHFQGAMCLEAFAAESGIVDVVNATPDTYVASFRDNSGREFDQPINAHDAVPIRLTRAEYQMAVFRNNQQVLSKKVDLSTNSVRWEVIGAPAPLQLGSSLEKAAAAAEAVGAVPKDIQKVRQQSFTSYMVANDRVSAERVGAMVAGKSNFNWAVAQQLASEQPAQIHVMVGNASPEELGQAAGILQTFGNLKGAADLYSQAAHAAKAQNPNQSMQFATSAYLSFAATGETAKAKELRHTYKIDLGSVCSECGKLEDKATKGDLGSEQILGNISTVKLVSGSKDLGALGGTTAIKLAK